MLTLADHLEHLRQHLPLVICEQERDRTFLPFILRCVRLGLPDAETMILVREFNTRCAPPWTERDMVWTLALARRVPTLPPPPNTEQQLRDMVKAAGQFAIEAKVHLATYGQTASDQ